MSMVSSLRVCLTLFRMPIDFEILFAMCSMCFVHESVSSIIRTPRNLVTLTCWMFVWSCSNNVERPVSSLLPEGKKH